MGNSGDTETNDACRTNCKPLKITNTGGYSTGTTSRTVMLWAKNPGSGLGIYGSGSQTEGNGKQWTWGLVPMIWANHAPYDNDPPGDINDPGNWKAIYRAAASDGTWHHFAATWAPPNTVKFYLDGILSVTNSQDSYALDTHDAGYAILGADIQGANGPAQTWESAGFQYWDGTVLTDAQVMSAKTLSSPV